MEPETRKKVLRKIPYGLYVVGVKQGDSVSAFTATWLSQASFEPPLLMLAVRRDGRAHGMIVSDKVFTVNFLGEDQAEIAGMFFKPIEPVNGKFGKIPFRLGVTGAPVLTQVPAYVECRVLEVIQKGDHSVVIGEVFEGEVPGEGRPLTLDMTSWKYGG